MDSTYRPYRPSGQTYKLTMFCYCYKSQKSKRKPNPSHFSKFLLASRTNGTFGFSRHTCQLFAKPKEPFYCNRTDNNDNANSYEFFFFNGNERASEGELI